MSKPSREEMAGKIAWAHLKELSDYYTQLEEDEEYWDNLDSSRS